MGKNDSREYKVFDVAQLPPLITIKKAAELTGVSSRTISRQCDSGEIYAVKVGRSWRINTAMLLEQMGVSSEGIAQAHAAMAGPISAKLYRDDVVQRQTEKNWSPCRGGSARRPMACWNCCGKLTTARTSAPNPH